MKKNFNALSIVLFILLGLGSCGLFKSKEQEKPKEVLPKVESIKDATDLNNKRVVVEGVYTPVDIRLKKTSSPVYTGQIALKLPENTLVFLYPPTSPEAKRPKAEIKEMNGQQVRIVGMIFKNMPTSDAIKAKLPPAIIASPYLTYIEKIELVNPLPPKKGRKK